MSSLYHISHHHTLLFFQKSLKWLFWVSLLRSIALAVVSTFTLIFIYQVGSLDLVYSWSLSPFARGMLTVVLYILLFRLACLLVLFPMSFLASKIKLSGVAIIANCLMITKFVLFVAAASHPLLIFVAAIISGIENAAFTPAYEAMFSKLSSTHKVGTDVGSFAFSFKIVYIVSPIIFGSLISLFGFNIAFVTSIMCMIFSSLMFWFSTWREVTPRVAWSDIVGWLSNRFGQRMLIAQIGRYLSDEVLGLWPIYVFLVVGSIAKVGSLVSIAMLASLIFSYFGGWSVDHTKRNMGFLWSGVGIAGVWMTRLLASSIGIILATDIANKICDSYFSPSFDAMLYRNGKGKRSYSFFIFLELMLSFVAIVLWLILGVIFVTVTDPWRILFVLASIGIMMSLSIYKARL